MTEHEKHDIADTPSLSQDQEVSGVSDHSCLLLTA